MLQIDNGFAQGHTASELQDQESNSEVDNYKPGTFLLFYINLSV